MPRVDLTYEVVGQEALKVFAAVLQTNSLHKVWNAVGGFDVETSILLTRNNSQESIEECWTTFDDSEGKRLLGFCRKAAKLNEDETCDWPPYLRLSHTLTPADTESVLEDYFMAICVQVKCIVGPSGGWSEILNHQQFKNG